MFGREFPAFISKDPDTRSNMTIIIVSSMTESIITDIDLSGFILKKALNFLAKWVKYLLL